MLDSEDMNMSDESSLEGSIEIICQVFSNRHDDCFSPFFGEPRRTGERENAMRREWRRTPRVFLLSLFFVRRRTDTESTRDIH